MSVSTVITEGYGSYGSVNFVVTDGYGNYGVAPTTPRDTHDPGKKKKPVGRKPDYEEIRLREERFKAKQESLRNTLSEAFAEVTGEKPAQDASLYEIAEKAKTYVSFDYLGMLRDIERIENEKRAIQNLYRQINREIWDEDDEEILLLLND